MSDIWINPAKPDEFTAVLEILFQRSTRDARKATIQQALRLLSTGELDPRGLLAAHRHGRLIGALLATATPGAVGLIWPPQVIRGTEQAHVEDALLTAMRAWLRQRGVKLVQALLAEAESDMGVALTRNGFRHITKLFFQRRWLDDLSPADWVTPRSLVFQPFDRDRGLFTTTLQRTYVGTLDCPEVEGARTIDEVIAGYKAQEGHDPARWWLVTWSDVPVAVVLANASREEPAWEVVYIGVVPESRGRGLGRHLLRHALVEAKLAEMRVVTLSVDSRNAPALRLYRKLGFEIWDERQVYLATLNVS